MTEKFLQPDYTSQSGTVYPLAIDAAISVLARLGAAFAPHAQDTPDMTVRVDAGVLFDGVLLTEVAAQNSGTITAPTTDPRIDRVVIDRLTGAVSVIAGVEAASPVAPSITVGKVPICRVLLQTSSIAISNSMITDERALAAFLAQDLRASWYRILLDTFNSPNVTINGAAFFARNGGEWIICGAADGTDALLWYAYGDPRRGFTEYVNPKNIDLNAIAVGGSGAYIMVGAADGTDAYILVSDALNGAVSEKANPKNFGLNDVAANGTTIVAVGVADGTDAYMVRSTDNGAIWAEVSNPKNFTLNSIAYCGSNTWVAVGVADGTDAYIIRSTDNGATWSEISNPKNIGLLGVRYSPELARVVATGFHDGIDTYCLTSDDAGATWTERTFIGPTSDDSVAVAAWTGRYFLGGNRFTAGSSAGVGWWISRSGESWGALEQPITGPVQNRAVAIDTLRRPLMVGGAGYAALSDRAL